MTPFLTQKRKANESHKQSVDQQRNKETVPDSEAYPMNADYLYLRPLEGARAPHCLVLELGVGGFVTPRDALASATAHATDALDVAQTNTALLSVLTDHQAKPVTPLQYTGWHALMHKHNL